MDKKQLKLKLKDFYTKLSIFRKNKKQSKSMQICFSSSEKKIKSIVYNLNLSDKTIADIGGADGQFIFMLAENNKINKNNLMVLVDISQKYLEKAENTYKNKFTGKFKFKTICSDIDDLKIKNKFDIVLLRDVLEHLYFPDSSIENIKNALKINGLFLVATPNKNRLSEFLKHLLPSKIENKLKAKLGTDVSEVSKLEEETGLKEHIHEYSSKELKQLLEKHNFKIINFSHSAIPFIAPGLCDRFSLIFYLQKALLSVASFFWLDNMFGFEHIVIAKRMN